MTAPIPDLIHIPDSLRILDDHLANDQLAANDFPALSVAEQYVVDAKARDAYVTPKVPAHGRQPGADGVQFESDPNGVDAHTGGAKLDAGKAPLFKGVFSYFARALLAVAKISAFGAIKYVWGGWKQVPDGINRYGDGLARHMAYEEIDGLYDSDSDYLHAAHAAWNALARLELILREGTPLKNPDKETSDE